MGGGLAAGIIIVIYVTQIIISNQKMYNEKQKQVSFQKINTKKYNIKNILVEETQKGYVFNISLTGSLHGEYELLLKCNTGMAKNFFIKKTTVNINSSNETIKVDVNYNNLETGLRKQLELEGHIISFNKEFGVNTMVEFHFGLRLLEDDKKYLSKLNDTKIPIDTKTITGKMYYKCYKNSCKIAELTWQANSNSYIFQTR